MSYKIIDNDHQRVAEFFGDHSDEGNAFASFTAVGLERDGELVAGVIYDYYNGQSVNAHIVAKGRNWLNRKFLWFAFYYPFEQMKVRRLTGVVPASNDAARKFDEHLGFVEECRLERAAPDGGDVIIYRMFKEDCKWLTPLYSPKKK